MNVEIINPDQQIERFGKKNFPIDLQSVNSRPIPHFTKDEMNFLLSNVPPNRDGVMFQFMWRTGCRVSEVNQVTKRDLNFQDGEITIKWLKSRKDRYRIIPMHRTLRMPLYQYTGMLNGPDRLFALTRQRIGQLCKKYGFDHPHKFRHSFAVNFLRQRKGSMGLVELQQLLGHADIKNTMEYLKVVPMQSKAALDEVEFD